jgi:hypothetical protein
LPASMCRGQGRSRTSAGRTCDPDRECRCHALPCHVGMRGYVHYA